MKLQETDLPMRVEQDQFGAVTLTEGDMLPTVEGAVEFDGAGVGVGRAKFKPD